MALLQLISEERENLPEINQTWTWAVFNTFRLTEPATSDRYLTEMIAWARNLKGFYFGDTHGPYRVGALASSNYVPCSAEEAEARFSEWISGFCPPESTDPERILSELIRPRLVGGELFAQTGIYDERERLYGLADKEGRQASRLMEEEIMSNSDPELNPVAGTLMGWIEVVAINRMAKTLTMVITSAD